MTASAMKNPSDEFTKKQKRLLRELAADAHERELALELTKLLSDFRSWEEGNFNPHELNQKIHEFHNGASRELFKAYAMGDPYFGVVRAIYDEILDSSQIDPDFLSKIQKTLDYFKELDNED